jgi:hypothetical protein
MRNTRTAIEQGLRASTKAVRVITRRGRVGVDETEEKLMG